MKYWELNTGDWFYVDEKPYIKSKNQMEQSTV